MVLFNNINVTPQGRTDLVYRNIKLQLDDGAEERIEKYRYVLVASGLDGISVIRVLNYTVPTYAAYRCKVLACMKTFSGAIRQSLLEESVESEHMMSTEGGDYSAADLNCLNSTGRRLLGDLGYQLEPDQRWTTWTTFCRRDLPGTILDKYCEQGLHRAPSQR